MTIIWLIVWALDGTPPVHGGWMVFLCLFLFLDFMGWGEI